MFLLKGHWGNGRNHSTSFHVLSEISCSRTVIIRAPSSSYSLTRPKRPFNLHAVIRFPVRIWITGSVPEPASSPGRGSRVRIKSSRFLRADKRRSQISPVDKPRFFFRRPIFPAIQEHTGCRHKKDFTENFRPAFALIFPKNQIPRFFRKSSWSRRSPPSSGWKASAI